MDTAASSVPRGVASAGVEGLRVGDAVFGLAPGCFGPSVVLPAGLVVPKPPNVTFVEAATLPTVFVTVYAALGERGVLSTDQVSTSGMRWIPSTGC